jgi:hypothetical protein
MALTRLCLTVLVLLTSAAVPAVTNSVRLHFDMYRNGALVADPELSVSSGTSGRLEFQDIGTISFTPTFRDSDTIAIEFDIHSGGRHLGPSLVIGRGGRGLASWSSTTEKDSFKFTVTWVP